MKVERYRIKYLKKREGLQTRSKSKLFNITSEKKVKNKQMKKYWLKPVFYT